MCSINGYTGKDEELVRRMNAATAHRGPDGTGVWSNERVTLGHNRLAIIDLSRSGAQPMQSHDGRFVLVFNGEIYNYEELRKELSYPYRSTSDTEVILAAYEAWGEKAFSRLNGIFALALWDNTEQKLLLVRDPMGVKPLYYHYDGQNLRFSSEIKAILEERTLSRRIDPVALDLYLRLLYVPAPHTMFAGIRKLLPGQMMVYRRGKVTVSSFGAEKKISISPVPFEKQKEALREEVRARVKEQLISERPVGLYLSGGIDSSVVLEAMTGVQKNVETFSVGFELTKEEQQEKFNADFLLARDTARYFGATHHEVLLSPTEILPLFEEAVAYLDEPVSNATIIPQLKLSRFAKKRVTVVLGGDGGDELFGGYERYRLSLLSSRYRRLPFPIRKGLQAIFPRAEKLDTAPGIDRYAQFHFQKEHILEPLLQSEHGGEVARRTFSERFFNSVEEPFETQFMRVDRESWLPDESLIRTDKLGMASGIEARVPLLGLPLVDFADTIPLSYKVSLFRTKIILKEAFRGFLPETLLRQPKRGWFSPGAKWLRYPHVYEAARDILHPDYTSATAGLFNWEELHKRLEAHKNGAYHFTPLFALLTLQLWARRFNVTR